MRPLVTVKFPGLPTPVQPLARTILHGFVGCPEFSGLRIL